MNILQDLEKRKIIKDITSVKKIKKMKNGDGVYIGFDPSGPSLHLGNYIQIVILKRFEKYNFKPFAVIGGATGMIGDPSGKNSERKLLDEESINLNKKNIKKQLLSFKLNVVDNLDFYKKMNILEFLRDVGKLLNINYMISKEIVKSRLEKGISFTEFSYQIIQGWDFKNLYEKYNVKIQIGGSDQWGNITAGLELIRKTHGENNYALGITTNLLLTSNGKKFGKSEGNAIWLDENLTTPFELYQHLLNSDDQNVEKFLKWLTFLDLKEIEIIIERHKKAKHNRTAQKILAFEVVKDIHGINKAQEVIKISNVIFGKEKIANLSAELFNELTKIFKPEKFKNEKLIDTLIELKITDSKRIARELINEGAIELNGLVIKNYDFIIEKKFFKNGFLIIKKGKKNFYLIQE